MCILSRLCFKTQTDLKITRITCHISSSRQVHPELQLTRRSESCSRKNNDLSWCKFILKLFPRSHQNFSPRPFPISGPDVRPVSGGSRTSQPTLIQGRLLSGPFPPTPFPSRSWHPPLTPSLPTSPLHSPLMSSRRSEVEQQIFLFLGGLLFFPTCKSAQSLKLLHCLWLWWDTCLF